MYTFFFGWRRKIGCLLLLMACAIAIEAVRSNLTTDYLEVPVCGRQHLLLAKHGAISWMSWNNQDNDCCNWAVSDTTLAISMSVRLPDIVEPWFSDAYTAGLEPRCWAIRSWLLVLPPTLLSAYLILWQPSKRASLA